MGAKRVGSSVCGRTMLHSLEGLSQTNISQHLLTCSPLHAPRHLCYRATSPCGSGSLWESRARSKGAQGKAAALPTDGHEQDCPCLAGGVWGLWPVLTCVRSQQRWGCSSCQRGRLIGAWEGQPGQSAVVMPRTDVRELVSILLSKQRKTDRKSGQITTSDQD